MACITVTTDDGEVVATYGRDICKRRMTDLAGDITDAAMDLLMCLLDDIKAARDIEIKGGNTKGGK